MAVEMDVCDNCEHSKLCKFREAYKELGQQAAANLDVPVPFKVVIVCPYYSRLYPPGPICRDAFTPAGACTKE